MTNNPVTLLEHLQNEVLEVFKFFIKLCEENNIQWFSAYGTALGAVRHQGFIPWDDDIDVLVPRPDYDRLLQLFSNADLGDYELVTPWNREGYYVPFSKLCKKNSTLVEQKDFPCVLGIFIDIFPLDACADDDTQLKADIAQSDVLNAWLIDSSNIRPIPYRVILANIIHGNLKTALDLWCCRRGREKFRLNIVCKIKNFLDGFPYGSTGRVTTYRSPMKIYRKEWYDNVEKGVFEGIEVNLPSNAEDMLRATYGNNFMNLPPVEVRETHHVHYFLNLDKRFDISEISHIVK